MSARFPARRVAGVVFDIDGTLLDNMPFHIEAFEAFNAAHGLPPLTLETRKWMDGKRNSDIFPGLFSRQLTPAEIDKLAHEKESAYRRLSVGRLQPLPGLLRLLDALDAAHVPVALATSAPRENVVHTLHELGLAQRLAVVARSDEVAHGKPEPDVFLEAARKLGVAARDCLAFEDAPMGLVSAGRAGMTCVAVSTSYPAEILAATDPPPEIVVTDFDELLDEAGAWLLQLPTTPSEP
jgi:HAD superfamily hydrolase (TIGR01509 family)